MSTAQRANGQGHQTQTQEYAGATLPTAIEELLMESGSKNGLSPRSQYEILRTQIAPGCSDEELAMFLYVCKSRGLDVWAKQAYAIRRETYDRELRRKVGKMTIQTSIDGFRLIAKRGGLDAQDEPVFEYSDAAMDDALNPLGLVKCTVRVWKKGSDRPTTSSAFWDEYRQTSVLYEDGKPSDRKKLSGKWSDMPRTMLAKVAEALTLRRAFPEELGALYTTDEMDQANNDAPAPRPVHASPQSAPVDTDTLMKSIEAAKSVAELAAIGKKLVDAPLPEDARKALRGAYAHRKNSIAKAAKAAAAIPHEGATPENEPEPEDPDARQPGDD